jgi:hypothetical protein
MLIYIAIAAVVLVAGVLAYAATRPDSFRISRSIRIAAPPERILPLIVDFREWPRWSPFEKLDPGMKRTFGGPPSGVGSSYAWEGNGKAGAGRMEILSADRSLVTVQLDFYRPMKANNFADFLLAPEGDGTVVTWVMRGPSAFHFKLVSVFVNIDRVAGKDFDAGLASLKAESEGGAPVPAGMPS